MTSKVTNASSDQTSGQETEQTPANQAVGSESAPKKVNRRGVGTARGTQRLKFTHEISKPNGLFIAQLLSVDVTNILIGEDKSGMPSFNGLEIPRIAFVFCSTEEDVNKRHYVTHSFSAIESNVKTIPGGSEEWKVNAMFDWFKHILNVYVFKGRDLTDVEEEALSLPFEDFDEQGDYAAIEVEEVIAGYKILFENVQNMLNVGTEGKPVYKTKDGKVLPVWVKLLRYTKNRKKNEWQPINNGDLALPTFVGEGCIELFRTNVNPSIRVDVTKEAIIPMNVEKAKVPNMGAGIGVPSMGGMPGAGMGNYGGPVGGSPVGDDDDVPF